MQKSRHKGRIGLGAVMCIGAAPSLAGAQEQVWYRELGTSSNDSARVVLNDGAGGVFVAGYTQGSLGGPSAGNYDVWLARYDAAGEQAWIRQFGTDEEDYIRALAPDSAGGFFAAGDTNRNLGGSHFGGFDGWLGRFDGEGHPVWIHQFGTHTPDFASALAPDGAGGVFIAGWTHSSLGGVHAGLADVWLARYDADGNRLWIRQWGTPSYDYASSLAVDGESGVYIGGWTLGGLGGAFAGGTDAWLARYDADGERVWIRQLGSPLLEDSARGLAPDGAGGVYVAGDTQGSLGAPSAGGWDAWVARYDSTGSRIWIRQLGTTGHEHVRAVATAGTDGVFIGGYTNGSLGGPNQGGYDAWMARYDPLGNQSWIRQFGTAVHDYASDITHDGQSGLFIAGLRRIVTLSPPLDRQDAWLMRWTTGAPSCYANCDGSSIAPILNVDDFICFVAAFADGSTLSHEQQVVHYANCDQSVIAPVLNVDDFICFITEFAAGCP